MALPRAAPGRLPARDLASTRRDPRVRQVLVADAAGDDRARAHQLQPARSTRCSARWSPTRRRAAIDARVPHLHAAAGHVLRRDRDRAVPGAQPPRRAPRPRRPARADRHRDAADLAAADPVRGGDRSRSPSRSPGSSTSAASSTPSRPSRSPRRCSGSPSPCPFAGVNLLLTRTFFCLQRPWLPTALAVGDLVVNVVVVARALRAARDRRHRDRHRGRQRGDDRRQAHCLRRELRRPRGGRARCAPSRDHASPSALLGARRLRRLVGARRRARPLAARPDRLRRRSRSPPASLVYAALVLRCGLPEARQILEPVAAQVRARRPRNL